MTNYEKIVGAIPKDLAIFLDGFDSDTVSDIYCQNCPNRNGGCPLEEGEYCPVDDIETIVWWLNQPAEGDSNE